MLRLFTQLVVLIVACAGGEGRRRAAITPALRPPPCFAVSEALLALVFVSDIAIALPAQACGAGEQATDVQHAAPLPPPPPAAPSERPGSGSGAGCSSLLAAYSQRLFFTSTAHQSAWHRGIATAAGSEQPDMVSRYSNGKLVWVAVPPELAASLAPLAELCGGADLAKSLQPPLSFGTHGRHSYRCATLKWRHTCCGWGWSSPSCDAC